MFINPTEKENNPVAAETQNGKRSLETNRNTAELRSKRKLTKNRKAEKTNN